VVYVSLFLLYHVLFAASLVTCAAMSVAFVVTFVVASLHAFFSAVVVYGALQSFVSASLRAAVALTNLALSATLVLLSVSQVA